jgi:hypothetical protein
MKNQKPAFSRNPPVGLSGLVPVSSLLAKMKMRPKTMKLFNRFSDELRNYKKNREIFLPYFGEITEIT